MSRAEGFLQIDIGQDRKYKFKLAATQDRKTMSEAAKELLDKYIAEKLQKKDIN